VRSEILLFGFSAATVEIAFHLRANGYEFLIIDDDEESIKKIQEYNFEYEIVDYNDDDVLKKIGIGSWVKTVFTLFLDDSKNIFLTISIRAIDESIEIVSLTQKHDTIHKLKAAGAKTVIDPYQISGKRIYEIIKKPEVVKVIDNTIFGKGDIIVQEIEIAQESTLDKKYLNELDINNKYDLMILGIYDKELKDKFYFVTDGKNHKLDSGDVLAVVGESEEIERFKKDYKT